MPGPLSESARSSAIRRAFDSIEHFKPAPVGLSGNLIADKVGAWAAEYGTQRRDFESVVDHVAGRVGNLVNLLHRQSIEPDLDRRLVGIPGAGEAKELLSAAVRARAVVTQRFGRRVSDEERDQALPAWTELRNLVSGWLMLHPQQFDLVRRAMWGFYEPPDNILEAPNPEGVDADTTKPLPSKKGRGRKKEFDTRKDHELVERWQKAKASKIPRKEFEKRPGERKGSVEKAQARIRAAESRSRKKSRQGT